MTQPRVVIHVDNDGDWTVCADPGVTVLCVSDAAPEDRVYRFDPSPIPDGLLDGPVGHVEDGSPAQVRAHRAAAKIQGQPHLVAMPPADGGYE